MRLNSLLLAGAIFFASVCSANDGTEIYEGQGFDKDTMKKLADLDATEQKDFYFKRMVSGKANVPHQFTPELAAEYHTLLEQREKGKKFLDKAILISSPHIAVSNSKAPIADQIASFEDAMQAQLGRLKTEMSGYEKKYGEWDTKTEEFEDEGDLLHELKNAVGKDEKERAIRHLAGIGTAKEIMVEDEGVMKTLDYMYGLKVKYTTKGVFGWIGRKFNEAQKIEEAKKEDLEAWTKKRGVPTDLPTRQRAHGIVEKPPLFKKTSSSDAGTSVESDEDSHGDMSDFDDLDAPIDPYGKPSERSPENTDLEKLLEEKSVPAEFADQFKPAADKMKLIQERASVLAEIKSLKDTNGALSKEQQQKLHDLIEEVQALEKNPEIGGKDLLTEVSKAVKDGNPEVAESFGHSFDFDHLFGADSMANTGSFSDLSDELERMASSALHI